jgi:opacity protein-like surface antigen
MNKTLTSVVALAGLAAAAGAVQAGDAVVAGDIDEPMELSLDQMDRLTAGQYVFEYCYDCTNVIEQNASVWQSAVAAAVGGGSYSVTEAEAENEAEIEQEAEAENN